MRLEPRPFRMLATSEGPQRERRLVGDDEIDGQCDAAQAEEPQHLPA